jgi:hypothetical protein
LEAGRSIPRFWGGLQIISSHDREQEISLRFFHKYFIRASSLWPNHLSIPSHKGLKFNIWILGRSWGYSSVVECLPDMLKSLDWITSTGWRWGRRREEATLKGNITKNPTSPVPF